MSFRDFILQILRIPVLKIISTITLVNLRCKCISHVAFSAGLLLPAIYIISLTVIYFSLLHYLSLTLYYSLNRTYTYFVKFPNWGLCPMILLHRVPSTDMSVLLEYPHILCTFGITDKRNCRG